MDLTVTDTLLVAVFFIAMSVPFIVLQVWLSIRETKWIAWVLPICAFLFSLNATYTSYTATVADGVSFGRVVLVFVLFNLLTAAFIITNFLCKTVQQRREEKAAKKKQKTAERAEKDKTRETIELK